MNALKSLKDADISINKTLDIAKASVSFVNKDIDRQIRSLTLAIKKELKVDYSKEIKFKPKEKERLSQILIDYLTEKSDDFNSHYIQLLAWHLSDIKVMHTKEGKKISIFEYSPSFFSFFSVVEKTFKLFQKKRIDVNKVSYALILDYLNNYKIASNRYKNVLKKYLKEINFSEELNVYFNTNNTILYTMNKTSGLVPSSEPYPERLLKLKIKLKTLDTVYFADSWFTWMVTAADLTSNYILTNLNCNYFKICNQDYQKIILAKIIYTNNMNIINGSKTELICMSFIFPVIKNGNPFKKEFWDLNYSGMYKTYLDHAWNYIEQTFVKNNPYKNMVNFEA